ncbi:MAG: polysaccharide deacetylase family protein [Gammaproteobacteria bacterium]|nr:polysaccharide deacetylase family protein [Gammaproteobacteria bacterium]
MAFLVTAMLANGPAMAADHCIILQYHHFSTATPPATSVAPERFEAHLEHLEEHAFRVMPLNEVVTALGAGTPLPERCVAITVDDAYETVYSQAYPRLRARGWPFTLFVNTDAVDAGLRPYLDWDTLREMAGNGVAMENHSASHDHLIRRRPGEDDETWRARVRGDIARAGRRIHEEIGTRPRLFAYPYGEFDLALEALVRDLGLTGFGQHSGPAWSGGDPVALPRFPMSGPYGNLESFATKLRTLPLPVARAEPAEPVVALDAWRPLLRLVMHPGDHPWQALRCYANGSPEVTIRWISQDPRTAEVRAEERLLVGRNRYNCTMPAGDGAFHWYSHNWFRRHADGRWYAEP